MEDDFWCSIHDKPETLGEDPYAAEINDDFTLYWMCDECRYEAAQDI